MPIRLRARQKDNNTGELTDPVGYTTYFDGQAFNWGPNEKRTFADSGVGNGHATHAMNSLGSVVTEDNTLTRLTEIDTHPSRS